MSRLPYLLVVLMVAVSPAAPPKPIRLAEPSYLPDAAASRVVTVTEAGAAAAGITMLTEAIAIKETAPRATVARFGEVYAFSPSFVAVHRDEPTEISFWSFDPVTLATTVLLHHDGELVGAVASAAELDGRFYFGAVFDDRIGVWRPAE